MIHISPWSATLGLFNMAGKVLRYLTRSWTQEKIYCLNFTHFNEESSKLNGHGVVSLHWSGQEENWSPMVLMPKMVFSAPRATSRWRLWVSSPNPEEKISHYPVPVWFEPTFAWPLMGDPRHHRTEGGWDRPGAQSGSGLKQPQNITIDIITFPHKEPTKNYPKLSGSWDACKQQNPCLRQKSSREALIWSCVFCIQDLLWSNF